MTNMHKSMVALAVGAMFTASGAAMAAVLNNNSFIATPSGDWNTAANWSSGTVPVSTDYAIVDGGNTATVSATPPTVGGVLIGGSGGNGTVDLSSGSVTETAGSGGLLIGAVTGVTATGAVGTLNISGGSWAVGQMDLGSNGTQTAPSTDQGILNLSGGSMIGPSNGGLNVGLFSGPSNPSEINISGGTFSIGNYNMGLGQNTNAGPFTGSAQLNITGDTATISGGGAGGQASLMVGPNGLISFTLGAAGVSEVNITPNATHGGLYLSTGSTLDVNMAAYTGPAATIPLISFGNFDTGGDKAGTLTDSNFTNVNITGVPSGYGASEQATSSAINLIVTSSVPEPATLGLVLGFGAMGLLLLKRRRMA